MHSEQPLKIGLLLDDSLDRPDGVQQYVLALGAWLTAQGHTVHYLAPSTQRTDLPNLHSIGRTMSVQFNGNRLGTPWPASRRTIRKLVWQLDLDVLHVMAPYSPLLSGRVIKAASRHAQKPALIGSFMIYPESRLVTIGAKLLGLIQRRQLKQFDDFIAISEAAQDFAKTAFHCETKVIGVPVNLKSFSPPAVEEPSLDGVSKPRGTSILFLGRLVPRKGAAELVEALGQLKASQPDLNWQAVIAGKGQLLQLLQHRAKELKIADQIEFPGFIAESDKAALLSSADIIALPATGGESFGISVVEALAAATGVVLAGDNPGYRTVMRGLETQLIDPKNTNQFAETLSQWATEIANPKTRAQITQAQQAAAARFDTPTIGAKIEAVYRRVLS